MCNCKMTNLQKVERQIQIRGIESLAPSQTSILDAYIFSRIGQTPSNVEERKEMYVRAKQS